MPDIVYASLGTNPTASIVSCATTIQEFADQGLDYSSFFQRANSFRCSLGPEPGIGWVLMTKSELLKLDSRSPQDLTFGVGDGKVVIKRLAIIQAQRVLSGASLDPDSLYLVQLADCRWYLKQTHINARYNLRETCDASSWCTGTLKTAPSTPWTFLEIVQDIWTHFSNFGGFFNFSSWDAGKIHEIGSTPTPENIRFEGISAWDALAQLCQQMGFFIRYDPIIGDVRIMKIGLSVDPVPGADGDLHAGYGGGKPSSGSDAPYASQFALTPKSLVRTDEDDLNDDSETLLGSALVPYSVQVVFPTNDADCGDFCNINENHGWYYSKQILCSDVRAVLIGDSYKYLDQPSVATSVVLNSTTFARFTLATDTVPVNATALNTLALSIAEDYYTSIGYQANGRVIFAGVKDIVPGPYVSEVIWREWGDGMKTEVARWPVTVGLPKPPKVFTGGAGCDSQNAKIDVTILGSPTGGTFDQDWRFNNVTETITFNYNESAASFKTALAGHSQIAATDLDVTGGPLPNSTIRVECIATQATTNVAIPVSNWSSLTGGAGVGVIASLAQLGHA